MIRNHLTDLKQIMLQKIKNSTYLSNHKHNAQARKTETENGLAWPKGYVKRWVKRSKAQTTISLWKFDFFGYKLFRLYL